MVLSGTLVLLLASLVAADEPEEARGRPSAEAPVHAAAGSAPGYCPSSGGSTQYERITSATLTPQAGGTMRLVVQVYIANPQGL